MTPVRVYLDTCVWLQPYDDQSQPRVRREALALRQLLERAERGGLSVVGSELVREELERVARTAEEVEGLLAACSLWARPSKATVAVARELVAGFGLSVPDAVHVALAAETGEHFFNL